jgi:hypothetical protein
MSNQIIRKTAKGQLVGLQFMQDAVAADQTDVQLEHEDGQGASEYVAPFDGEIVGISYLLSAAGTAGSMTLGGTVGGTEDADTTMTVTTAASGYQRTPRGSAKFVAGAALGVELTTDSGWLPITSDLLVTLWVLLYLEGI